MRNTRDELRDLAVQNAKSQTAQKLTLQILPKLFDANAATARYQAFTEMQPTLRNADFSAEALKWYQDNMGRMIESEVKQRVEREKPTYDPRVYWSPLEWAHLPDYRRFKGLPPPAICWDSRDGSHESTARGSRHDGGMRTRGRLALTAPGQDHDVDMAPVDDAIANLSIVGDQTVGTGEGDHKTIQQGRSSAEPSERGSLYGSQLLLTTGSEDGNVIPPAAAASDSGLMETATSDGCKQW